MRDHQPTTHGSYDGWCVRRHGIGPVITAVTKIVSPDYYVVRDWIIDAATARCGPWRTRPPSDSFIRTLNERWRVGPQMSTGVATPMRREMLRNWLQIHGRDSAATVVEQHLQDLSASLQDVERQLIPSAKSRRRFWDSLPKLPTVGNLVGDETQLLDDLSDRASDALAFLRQLEAEIPPASGNGVAVKNDEFDPNAKRLFVAVRGLGRQVDSLAALRDSVRAMLNTDGEPTRPAYELATKRYDVDNLPTNQDRVGSADWPIQLRDGRCDLTWFWGEAIEFKDTASGDSTRKLIEAVGPVLDKHITALSGLLTAVIKPISKTKPDKVKLISRLGVPTAQYAARPGPMSPTPSTKVRRPKLAGMANIKAFVRLVNSDGLGDDWLGATETLLREAEATLRTLHELVNPSHGAAQAPAGGCDGGLTLNSLDRLVLGVLAALGAVDRSAAVRRRKVFTHAELDERSEREIRASLDKLSAMGRVAATGKGRSAKRFLTESGVADVPKTAK